MQDALIQRYLGNKSPIVPDIVAMIDKIAQPGDLIFDAFSGTLAVSVALRQAGFQVACNDINHFSWAFAKAYFTSGNLPWPEGVPGVSRTSKQAAWRQAVNILTSPDFSSLPEEYRRTDFFDHYCEQGSKSSFLSKRGKSGKRRFFSAENASKIDLALNRIRYWHREEDLPELTRCLLTALLLSAIEKVSNTQGTFHDFPRDFIDPRALKPLEIRLPQKESFLTPISDCIGKAEDTLDFVCEVPKHRVMYIDPPYNFRQYTSYYFMLNQISMYPEIDDLDRHFDRVEFVRGQNMETDFKSTFCSKGQFISSLKTLIARADTDFVVLSYFDGRNHWGAFKSDTAEQIGGELLEEFFCGPCFIPGSFERVPVKRLNYQSYGGYSAKAVNEFLFIAEKSKLPAVTTDAESKKWIGPLTNMRVAS